jgi:poly(hydroxyalkanoate) depolymerase family esterase
MRFELPVHHWDAGGPGHGEGGRADSLQRATVSGDNPAGLGMVVYVPEVLAPRPALVVLLHGCQQEPANFAQDTGWVGRASRAGAVLVLPEQTVANNPNRCFNWFRLTEVDAGAAEMLSIRSMVEQACQTYQCDKTKVFVVGLSAGGAMAAALMAAYPDLIGAGAVVAGLPVGCARSMTEALGRMAQAGPRSGAGDWGDRARKVGPAGFKGPWPRLSVWHGTADKAVDPENGELLVQQWISLHGLSDVPTQDLAFADRSRQRTWRTKSNTVVEWWTIPGLEHGYPVGESRPGGKWVLPSQVDATDRIADFFGLGH